jgi:hypothetical protein
VRLGRSIFELLKIGREETFANLGPVRHYRRSEPSENEPWSGATECLIGTPDAMGERFAQQSERTVSALTVSRGSKRPIGYTAPASIVSSAA